MNIGFSLLPTLLVPSPIWTINSPEYLQWVSRVHRWSILSQSHTEFGALLKYDAGPSVLVQPNMCCEQEAWRSTHFDAFGVPEQPHAQYASFGAALVSVLWRNRSSVAPEFAWGEPVLPTPEMQGPLSVKARSSKRIVSV